MNVAMQIEPSVCNSPHVAKPLYTTADITSSANSHLEDHASATVPASNVVYTVTSATRTPGAAPQLVKVVPSADGTGSQLIKVVNASVMSSTSPGAAAGDVQNADGDAVYHSAAVIQRSDDGASAGEGNIVSQRVYSLVSATPKSQAANQLQKSAYNNGQQRLQAVTALPANARVLPVAAAHTPQKVQILSNVVVSKQNIMLNKSGLQHNHRQVITSLAQKQLNNNTATKSTAVGKATVATKAANNLVIPASQQAAGKVVSVNSAAAAQQKSLKTVVNRAAAQAQKTIKTLSPQSPGYTQKPAGIKTLSPQINHYNKMQNAVKLIPAQPQVSPRVGIKTLAPQRNAVNARPSVVMPKPNYIGKHAAQAQKAAQKPGPPAVKGRGAAPQRMASAVSPGKYSVQKQAAHAVTNAQSTFNQSLTAQILQSLPSSGGRSAASDSGYHSGAKSYPQLQSPPDDTTLSEDIGEEVRPDFSPNLSYLYQVVMLDHNYGAPPPPISPAHQRQPSSSMNGTVSGSGNSGGAGSAAAGTPGYYGTAASGKRHGRLPLNSNASSTLSTSMPASAHHMPMTSSALSSDSRAAPDDDAASTISSDGGRHEDGDEGEETETAPEGEGDEDGVTRCICEFDHDDGYMICCDECSSWQHVDCMGLDRDHIPDKYSCVRCEPRRVDRQHARTIQQRKREEFARIGGPPGTLVQGAAAGAVGGSGAANSGSISDSSSETSTAESAGEGHHVPANTRHHSVSLNNNLIGKKRTTPVSLSSRRKSEPASQNRRAPLAHKRQQRRESAREASVAGRRTVAMKKREKKQVMKRKMKSRSSIDDDSQDSWPAPTVAAYPNTMGASLLQLRQWIENYEEAVTNHYSPELRARITNMRANGTHTSPHHDSKQAPANAQADVAVQKCKVSSQPLTGLKIVMATQLLPPNAPVIELRGKYMLSTQHRGAATGPQGSASSPATLLTRHQHAQRPGPFLFFYRLPRDGTEVCVDTRTYGNDARFIRRSCRPNAELRHCVEKGTLHLYVITITPVEKHSELTIKHESHDLAAAAAAAATAGTSAPIPCACGNPQQCGLFTNHRKNGGNLHEVAATASSGDKNNSSNSASNSASHPDNKTPVDKAATASNSTEANSSATHRKRRGRRASSPGRSVSPPPVPEALPSPGASHAPVHHQAPPPALSTRRASSHHQARAASSGREVEKEEHHHQTPAQAAREQREQPPELPAAPKSEKPTSETKDKKKMTREERKMEAIMKAFERLEKAQQRKQEVQARQAQRRESDPLPSVSTNSTSGKHQLQPENGDVERETMRNRRKKRKGRSRTTSTNSQSSTRRRRVNSTDSYMTSGDESSLLSPPLPVSHDVVAPSTPEPKHIIEPAELESPVKSLSGSQVSELSSPGQVNTAAGLLLALANGGSVASDPNLPKSPDADGNSSGSNSSLQSSPGTPLSSACLLVAAAVGPLEPGFKFPKTKKAIMNEWLNKSPEPIQPVSSMSPMLTLHQASVLDQVDLGPQHPVSDYYTATSTANKSLATLVQAASLCDSPPQGAKMGMGVGQGVGNAKKRWLRQAISEECDSPCSRPESPPGNSEMVAPPKKRRLARESLSSEQSFTPPTTPTMLVPPSNSLAEEDYPNNDEEFYTTEDRTVSNSSPPNPADFQKPITKDAGSHQRLDLVYSDHHLLHSAPAGPGAGGVVVGDDMNMQHADLEVDNGLKDRCTEMQLEFGVITGAVKRDDVLDTISKKYPDTLSTSLMDPRLGRDRPIFRDSAQLLGTVEKTIRFYEENLTGPVPQVLPMQEETKEKVLGKPEMVTPAKRKLSISEYRQRKQLVTPNDRSGAGGGSSGGGGTTPERPVSPETPPPMSVVRGPVPRGRSDSTSSATSSLSSDEEPLGTAAVVDVVKPVATVEPQVAVAFNSAPTAVERQRENVERLKKVFGLALDDDVRKTTIVRAEPALPIVKTTASVSPTNQPSSSTDIIKPSSVVVAPATSAATEAVSTKYILTPPETDHPEKSTKHVSPDTTYSKGQSPESQPAAAKHQEKHADLRDEEIGYARFDEAVSTSFIPPFNNPVYPNSTQFTNFTSVIDTSPYEGRNPSPPPGDMLAGSSTRLTSYPMPSANSALSMSPSSSSYKRKTR